MAGLNKLLFLISTLLMASTVAPTLVIAQEDDQTHPFLSDRFQLAVGVFSRQQDFKIAADGSAPEEEIDFDETLGVHFQAFKHLGVGLNYHYFSLNADVDSDDWRGGAELKYRGPFLALTTNW
jgi:hypothetical protein